MYWYFSGNEILMVGEWRKNVEKGEGECLYWIRTGYQYERHTLSKNIFYCWVQ